MATNKGKNIVIDLSSSSSSDDNGDEDDTSSDSASFSSGDACESIDDDDDEENEDDEEEGDDSCEDDCHGVEDDDDHSLANRVIRFLQGRRSLQELSLKACKAYLRKHGLRVSGKKNECIHRVQEHWRLKDGKAESLYPVSSFVINCTGDVCKGDIVLFKQKVYGSFDKVTRKGKLLGRRTVVGRVVKESYGAAKQQHTFTVEVLWSKGIKKLPAFSPMLVKGRNLYRLKTYRQLWKNEGERSKVLAEKHRRGTVARCNRAKRINVLSTDKGGKSRKVSHCRRSSQMSFPEGGKHYGTEKGASYSITNRNNKQHNVKKGATQSNARSQFSKPFPRSQNLGPRDGRISTLPSYHLASQKYPKLPPSKLCYRSRPSSSRSTEFQGEILYHGPVLIPAAPPCVSNQRSFGNSYDIQSPWMTHMDTRQLLTSETVCGQWMNGPLNCSFEGCGEPGSYGCVIAACWRCCLGMRMGCNVHR